MVGHLPQGQILDSSGLMASEALHWGAAGSWGGALCTAAIAVGNKPHLYCSLSSLTLCWSGIWILPLPLLLNKPSRENNERQWKGREERRRKERERGQRREERKRSAVCLHLHGSRKWDVELLLGILCQESPWRLSAGLFMINTLRQLSSWSLLKYTLLFKHNDIQSRKIKVGSGGGECSITRMMAGSGPFPEERKGRLTSLIPLPPPSLDPELPISSPRHQHPRLKGPCSAWHRAVFNEHLMNEFVHSLIRSVIVYSALVQKANSPSITFSHESQKFPLASPTVTDTASPPPPFTLAPKSLACCPPQHVSEMTHRVPNGSHSREFLHGWIPAKWSLYV